MAEQEQTPKKKMGTGAIIALGCGGLVLVGIIIFVIVTILGVAGIAKVANSISDQQKETDRIEADAFNNPSKIGDKVTVKDVAWTITKAENLGSKIKSVYSFGDDCVANSGMFIKVTVKIKNNSDKMVSVTDLNLYDSQKREYTTSSEVFNCTSSKEELFILSNINPGIEKTFVGIYEVPSDSKDFRVKVGDLDLFTDGHKYVSLGF